MIIQNLRKRHGRGHKFMVTKLTTLQHIGGTHSTFMIGGEVKENTTVLV
jgi:Lrp/AsnC family leucine-responsive transcriptional regulator